MENTRLLLVGLGSLGSQVLDLLLRAPFTDLEILVAGRNKEAVDQRMNLAMLAAVQLGHLPNVSSAYMDLMDLERSAELIYDFKPDVVFSSACLQSWWVPQSLPKPLAERLDLARVGPWLPMHLTLVHKLMQAIGLSGTSPIVVNSSYPDVTHPILSRLGVAPAIGIGNVANPVPALRQAMASRLDVSVDRIQVRLFAHHYVSHRVSKHGDAGGAPFHLTVYLDGEDVTERFSRDTFFSLLPTRFKRPGGVMGQLITATSAIDVLRAIILDENRVVHAPGPKGMPGGYAVRLGRNRLDLELPVGLSREDAIRINEDGMRFDGVERIDSSGTAWFTEREMSIMAEMLGYQRESMRPDQSEDCARELLDRYREFRSRVDGLRTAA
jgi:hypothetical protein